MTTDRMDVTGSRWRPVSAALLLVLAQMPNVAAEKNVGEPDIGAVPYPTLQKLEAPIQEQLTAEREFLDSALSSGQLDRSEKGLAFGAMGQLYLTYNLLGAAAACFDNAVLLLPDDFRWSYYLGVIRQTEGDLDRAIEQFDRARALRPGDLPVRLRLARIRIDRQELDQAEVLLGEILDEAPGSAAAHVALGRVAYERGDLETAIAEFERGLELQPEAGSIHYLLGQAYRRSGDLEQAKQHLQSSQRDEVTFADPLIDELADLRRGARGMFESAVRDLQAGNVDAAVEQLRQAIARNDQDALLHHTLGLALVQQGADEEAVRQFQRALELNPEYSQAYAQLGSVLARMGRFDLAVAQFEQAYRLDPQDEQAHLDWATTLSMTGKTDQALQELQQLLSKNPDNVTARLHLGILLASMGDGTAARQALRQVIAAGEPVEAVVLAHRELAEMADAEGEFNEAVDHYRSIVDLMPNGIAGQEALARALGRAGRFSEAADYYTRLIAMRPQEMSLHFSRAMALILGQEYAAALSAIEASHLELPGEISLTNLLARFLATCPEADLRDGSRALALAEQLWAEVPNIEHAATMAMALAEVGRFPEAVEWQTRVIDMAAESGQENELETALRRQQGYRSGQPVRAPWIPGN